MESRRNAALIAVAGLVVAVALFLVLQGGDDDTDPTTTTPVPATSAQGETGGNGQQGEADKPEPKPEKPELPRIEVKGGEPVGGAAELEFESGDQVRFEVTSDTADELHLHGYDLYFDLKAGKPAEIAFDATLEGGYELESHTTGTLIANVSIVPG